MASPGLPELIEELERRLSASPAGLRDTLLDRITTCFLVDAPRLEEDHVAIFDEVIYHLAQGSRLPSRIQLSERIADLANAPLKVVGSLARDDIAVARPLLQRSPRLSEDMLVGIVDAVSYDHLIAITERRNLPAPVTDALLARGDRLVLNAVASNHTARFSENGFRDLIDHAMKDELLQFTLTQRGDIPRMHLGRLLELARDTARRRMDATLARMKAKSAQAALHGEQDEAMPAVEPGAVQTGSDRDYAAAIAEVSELAARDALTEAQLVDYARSDRFEHTVCAMAYMARVPVGVAERVLSAPDHDLVLIAARSIDLEWPSVWALIRLRREGPKSRQTVDQIQESYHKLTKSTAQRVLRFIQARESAGRGTPSPAEAAGSSA